VCGGAGRCKAGLRLRCWGISGDIEEEDEEGIESRIEQSIGLKGQRKSSVLETCST
jgi:hypothetical protein